MNDTGIIVEVTFPAGFAGKAQKDPRLTIAGARYEGAGKSRRWIAQLYFKDKKDYIAFLVASGLADIESTAQPAPEVRE